MTLGMIFLICALLLFALEGMGATVIPRAQAWGLFFFVLGVLLSGIPIPWK